MPKSISELRASGQVRRRTRDHTICLDVELADQYREKRQELYEAAAELEEAGEAKQQPGRLGSRPHKELRERVEALGAELDELADQMAEFEVVVTLQQAETEAWNDWAAANPPREQLADEMGRRALVIRDAQHGGRCNFDALVKDLDTWVIALNGSPVADGEWEWLVSKAAPGDVDDVAGAVLELHTGRVSLPKSLSSSLATLIDAIDSTPPEPGTPAPAASTGGSRSGKRATSTTKKAV